MVSKTSSAGRLRYFARAIAVVLFSFLAATDASLAQDAEVALRFDVATFCCPCSVTNHLCDPQFEVLNWPSTSGHYLAMGTDWAGKRLRGMVIDWPFTITLSTKDGLR